MAETATQSFLGTGWTFPPTFNPQTATVIMSSDVANIRESLWILFSTNLGERIMLATYGCNLWRMVFDSLTTTVSNEIRSLIANAILTWEPRIDVIQIAIEEMAPLDGHLTISVDFIVRQTNTRSNFVYPFYLQEATLPPPSP